MEEFLTGHLLLTEPEFLAEIAANTAGIAIDMETGRVIHSNREAERLFKCQVKNGLSGLPYEKLIPSELREKHARYVKAYSKDPHTRSMGDSTMRLRALTLNGDSFSVAITLRPIKKLERLYVVLTFMPIREGD